MKIVVISCLSDNYAYLVAANGSRKAIVVDPSEAAPVIDALEREGLELVAILNTHHHYLDHVGGNEALLERYGKLPIYAHESDRGRVPGQTMDVKEGTPFEVAKLEFRPLHVPGHTTGAVTYVVEDAAFTGDTLFVAGCGRLFEGTPEMMNVSLNDKLAKLPSSTRIFCGHEYTFNNLRFALHVEPNNEAIQDKLERVREMRERGEPTVGSTMGEELATNPFLRVNQAAIKAHYRAASPGDVLGAIRKDKDSFK